MTTDEDKRRDSKRENAHLGDQARFTAGQRPPANAQRADDLGPLPAELDKELRKLEEMFTVDAAKLREISSHFENELRRGLSRVSRCLLPSPPSSVNSSPSSDSSVDPFAGSILSF